MAKQQEDTKAESTGGARGPRSPNFPAISLPDAIQKVKILYEKDRRAAVSVKTVLTHFGFGEKLSGSSARVLSALRQFGLLDDVAGNYRVSETAYMILSLSESSPQRVKAIQDSARKPAIYREVLSRFEEGLPSDAAFSDFLIAEKKFNTVSVDNFIRSFRASMAFAKVLDGAYTPTEELRQDVKVGDFVQWSPQGVDQFPTPLRITSLSEDGQFVQVEGSMTGLPIAEVQKTEAPTASPVVGMIQPPTFPPKASGVAREVSAFVEGEAVLQWPANMSADSILELEDWLQLVIKKMKRRYGVAPTD